MSGEYRLEGGKVLNFYNILLTTLLVVIHLAPNIGGREYIGSIFLLIIFILIIQKGIALSSLNIYFLIFTFIISIIDLLIMHNSPYLSATSSFYGLIYNFVPLIAFLSGSIFAYCKVNLNHFDKIIIIIGSFQAILGIFQLYFNSISNLSLQLYSNFEKYSYFFEMDSGRAIGTLGNPNFYGVFISWFILSIIFYYLPKYNKFSRRIILIIIALVSFFALIISQSRTAFIIFGIGLLVLSLIHLKRKVIVFPTISFLLIFVFFVFDRTLSSYRSGTNNSNTLGGRTDIWESVVNNNILPLDWNILFGSGSYFVSNYVIEPHNYYLEFLLEYGLIGLIGYLILLILFVNKARKIDNKLLRRFLFITLITIIIADMTSEMSAHIKLGTFYYILIGFIISYSRVNNKRRSCSKNIALGSDCEVKYRS